MKLYKIRDLSTGLYSLGGNNPSWNKVGKVWRNIGSLKVHIRYQEKYYGWVNPMWEVVELDVVEGERYGVHALLNKEGKE